MALVPQELYQPIAMIFRHKMTLRLEVYGFIEQNINATFCKLFLTEHHQCEANIRIQLLTEGNFYSYLHSPATGKVPHSQQWRFSIQSELSQLPQ